MDDMKQYYDEIEIPGELDMVIEKAISRGRKQKKMKFIRPAADLASLAAAFVMMVNVSPAFAYYMKDIPGLSYLVELANFDKGLKLAAENGFVQEICKSAESNGIKFTVDNVILDRKRLIVAYTVESAGEYSGLFPQNIKISKKDGELVDTARVNYSAPDNSSFPYDGKCSGLFDVILRGGDGDTFPETIGISVGTFVEQPITGREVQGDWRVEFNLDKSLMDVKPRIVDSNRKISIEGMEFRMDYIKIYPTVVEIKLRNDKDNAYRFTGFKNLYLEDEKGNKYRYTGGTIPGSGTYRGTGGTVSQTETLLNFESNYFIEAKKLYLGGDGIYTMPIEDKYLVVDLEDKKVIDDGGYGIEYLYDKRNEMWGHDSFDLIMAFSFKDKEIIQGMDPFGIELDSAAYDESNNKYDISGRFSTDEKDRKTGFMIEKMYGNPRILKVKINSVNNGIMKPFKIRLK